MVSSPNCGFRQDTSGSWVLWKGNSGSFQSHKIEKLAIDAWTEPVTMSGTEFHDRVDILEVNYRPTLALSVMDSWTGVVRAVLVQAPSDYT